MSAEADRRVRAECREWLTLMHSGEVSEADRARFMAWLEADQRHELAYAKLETLWGELGELRKLAPVPKARARVSTRTAWAAAAGIAALALLMFWSRFDTSPTTPVAGQSVFSETYATQLAEVREVSLPDGSRVTLGARSRVTVRFANDARRVQLDQGEAFFIVMKDAAKPFHVEAGNAAIRVVGTRFEVRRAPEHVRITVAEGVVKVKGRDAPLTGGQRIDVLRNGALTAVESVPREIIGAWREGRLIYEGASLEEVVADLGRYRDHVELGSADAGALRVTAGLRVDQIDAFLDRLPDILPVRVTRDGASVVVY